MANGDISENCFKTVSKYQKQGQKDTNRNWKTTEVA